jgi:hypothetical protein
MEGSSLQLPHLVFTACSTCTRINDEDAGLPGGCILVRYGIFQQIRPTSLMIPVR